MQQYNMTQAEAEKIHVEIAKLMAETSKLNAEARKMNREAFWYPVAVSGALIGSVAAITALLLKVIS